MQARRLVLLALVLALVASAQPQSQDDDLREQARRLTSEGRTLAVEQLYRERIAAHESEPAIVASLLAGLAGHYLTQQQYVKAAATENETIALLESAYGKEDARLRHDLLAAAGIQEQMNDFTAAEAFFRRADTLPAAPAPSNPNLPVRPSELADFFARHQRWPQAEQVYRELARRDDLTFPVRIAVLNGLAGALARQHRESEALAIHQEIAKLSEASDDPLAARAAAQARQNAAALNMATDPDAGRRFYEAEIQRTAALTGPARTQYAQALTSYAMLLERQQQFDDAEKVLRQYLAEAQAQSDAAGPFKSTTAYAFLANLEYQRGNMDAGHQWRSQDPALQPREVIPPPALAPVSTAQRLFDEGNTEDANAQIEQALLAVTAGSRDATYRLGQVTALIMTLRQSGQTEAADTAFHRATATLERLYGADSPQAMQLQLDYCQQFCPEEGLRLAARARLADAQRHGPDHPAQLDWIEREILFSKQANRAEDIEAAYGELIRLSGAIYGPRHSRTLMRLRDYAGDVTLLKLHARRLDQLWHPILDLSADIYGRESLDYTGTLTGYAFSLARVDQYDRALDLLDRHLRLLASYPNESQALQQTETTLDRIRKMKAAAAKPAS